MGKMLLAYASNLPSENAQSAQILHQTTSLITIHPNPIILAIVFMKKLFTISVKPQSEESNFHLPSVCFC